MAKWHPKPGERVRLLRDFEWEELSIGEDDRVNGLPYPLRRGDEGTICTVSHMPKHCLYYVHFDNGVKFYVRNTEMELVNKE